MAGKLLTWSALWLDYPDYEYFPDSAEVKKEIGGAVNADWVKNTCAIRLSATLNKNGFPVPGKFAGLATLKGGDGKRYAIRVAEVRKWLPTALGAPDFDHKKKAGTPFDKTTIASMKGIIAFDISFSDATGHLDLWDGKKFSSEYKTNDYWTAATRITIWKAS